jgi:SAM-dependent methyltransferase
MNFKGVEICCPVCRGDLLDTTGETRQLVCQSCGRTFPVILDIPDLRVFPDPYIETEADHAKGLQIGERFDEFDFAALVDFYYSITSAVPKEDARRYTRGLLGGAARARASLDSWEEASRNGHKLSAGGKLLEIGCGTAPLLVAAASRFDQVVGVDIAFRWLVVAKRRLADAGLDLPLICACAEALPFPDEAFDRVVADSVLEHVSDQPRALAQCHRVLNLTGRLFVSTPNRFSLGPDPQVGIWCGGMLPERWLAAYVERQGGIPPKRHLLSARSLSILIQQAGFSQPSVMLPDIANGQRDYFGKGMQMMIGIYQTAKRLPVSRQCLQLIGPLLHAVAEKGSNSSNRSAS